MDAEHFDTVTRQLAHATSRRVIGTRAVSVLLGAAITAVMPSRIGAKRRRPRRRCQPCRVQRHGKCKGSKPDGTPCGAEHVCRDGECVSARCDPPCADAASCVNGECVCPDSAYPCGEVCCAEAPVCTDGACRCPETGHCRCPEGDVLCEARSFTQCCLDDDRCDKFIACHSDTCSAANAMDRQEWAACSGGSCACFTTRQGEHLCADATNMFVFGCLTESECSVDDDCPGPHVCVDISRCRPGAGELGMCMHPCTRTQEPLAHDDTFAARKQRFMTDLPHR